MKTEPVEGITLPAGTALPRRRLVFGIIAIGLFMISVDQTIIATALGAIEQDFSVPVTWTSWTLTIYALGQIIAMSVAGRLADEFGRRRIFLLAVGIFTAASLCCGLANSVYLLVALRFVQSLGAGAVLPSATGIVAEYFGPSRDRAVGTFNSIFPIGGIIGPILGGLLVAGWTWRAVFLVNVPFGLLLLVLGWRFIARQPPKPSGKVDVVGIALLASLTLSAMLGMSVLGSGRSPGDPLFWAPELLAGVLVIAFLRHITRHPAPVVAPVLLHGHGFGAMNIVNLLFGAAVLGFGALVPVYAQWRYGMDPLSSGTVLTARAVGTICLSGVCVLALRRIGNRIPMILGFGVLAVGLFLLTAAPRGGMSPYEWLSMSSAITGVGMGIAVPATNNAGLHLSPDRVAAITGLRGMFRQVGAIISVSVASALVSRSSDPGIAQARAFAVFAVLLLGAIPLILRIPEHRGRW